MGPGRGSSPVQEAVDTASAIRNSKCPRGKGGTPSRHGGETASPRAGT
jgi:hypothetical protein